MKSLFQQLDPYDSPSGSVAKLTSIPLALLRELQARAMEADRARRHSAILADVSAKLFSSFEIDINLARIAQFTVPLLGNWCLIDLLNSSGIPERAQVAHSNPDQAILANRLKGSVHRSFESTFIQQVIETRRSALFSEIFLKAHVPELGIEMLVRSMMIVPILLRGDLLGVFTFFVTEEDRSTVCENYGEAELQLAEEIAYRTAIAIDNSHQFFRATRAIDSRDQFFNIVSHELKTPLTAISLQNELLRILLNEQNFGRLNVEKARSILESSQTSIQHLRRLVNELLDASSIEQGTFKVILETIDLSKFVEDFVERFSNQFEGKKTQLKLTEINRCFARCDRQRIEQILGNLITNAMKYAPDSDIWISLRECETYHELAVQDFGPGISHQDQHDLFKKYERGKLVRDKVPGFGLGLYISEQIMKAHGGSIHVVSEIGQGSTFSVRLPRVKPFP